MVGIAGVVGHNAEHSWAMRRTALAAVAVRFIASAYARVGVVAARAAGRRSNGAHRITAFPSPQLDRRARIGHGACLLIPHCDALIRWMPREAVLLIP